MEAHGKAVKRQRKHKAKAVSHLAPEQLAYLAGHRPNRSGRTADLRTARKRHCLGREGGETHMTQGSVLAAKDIHDTRQRQ